MVNLGFVRHAVPVGKDTISITIAGWEPIYTGDSRCHLRFHGSTPEALVAGRERLYLDHFWSDFAAHPERSVEKRRCAYASAYVRDGRMAAGFTYFVNLRQTATEFSSFVRTPLGNSVLTIAADRAARTSLGAQARKIAHNVTDVVLSDRGHWLLSERPERTIAELRQFLNDRIAS